MDTSGSYFFDDINCGLVTDTIIDEASHLIFERSLSTSHGFSGLEGALSTPQTKSDASALKEIFNKVDLLEYSFDDFPERESLSSSSVSCNSSVTRECEDINVEYNFNDNAYKLAFVESSLSSSTSKCFDDSLNSSGSCLSFESIKSADVQNGYRTNLDVSVSLHSYEAVVSTPLKDKSARTMVSSASNEKQDPESALNMLTIKTDESNFEALTTSVQEVLGGYVYHKLSHISEVSSSEEKGSNEINSNCPSLRSYRLSEDDSINNKINESSSSVSSKCNSWNDEIEVKNGSLKTKEEIENSMFIEKSTTGKVDKTFSDPFYEVQYEFETPIVSASVLHDSLRETSFVSSTCIEKESGNSPFPRTSSECLFIKCADNESEKNDSFKCGLLMLSSSDNNSAALSDLNNSSLGDDDLILDFPSVSEQSSTSALSKINESRLVKFYTSMSDEKSIESDKFRISDSIIMNESERILLNKSSGLSPQSENLSLLINEYKSFKQDPVTSKLLGNDFSYEEVCLCLRNADLKITKLKNRLKFYDDSWEDCQKELVGMRDQIECLQMFISSLPKEVFDEANRVQNRSSDGKMFSDPEPQEDNFNSESELSLLREELLLKMNNYNELKTKYDSLYAEHSSCETLLRESNINIKSLQLSLSNIEEEHSKLKIVCEELSESLKNISLDVKACGNDVVHKMEKDNLKLNLNELECINEGLKNDLINSSNKYLELVKKIEIMESSNESLESELSYIKEKCSFMFSRPFGQSEEIVNLISEKNIHLCNLEEEKKRIDSLLTHYINSENNLIKENNSLKERISELSDSTTELLSTKTEYEKLDEGIRQMYIYLFPGLEIPNTIFETMSVLKKKMVELIDIEETLKKEQNKNILLDHLKMECKFLLDSLAEEKSEKDNLKSALEQKEASRNSLEQEFKMVYNKCELLNNEIALLKGKQTEIGQKLSSSNLDNCKLLEIIRQIKILFNSSDSQHKMEDDDILLTIKNSIDDLKFTKKLLNDEKEKSSQLDKEYNSLDLRNQYLESRLSNIFKENNFKVTSVLEESNKVKKVNKQLENEKEYLEKTVEELQSKVMELEKNVKSSFLRKHEELLRPLTKVEGECTDCCRLTDNLKELKLDLVDQTSKVTRLEINVESLRNQSERRLKTIDNYKTKIIELKTDLKKAQSAMNKKVRHVETYVDFLRREKVDMSSQTENNEDLATVKAPPSKPPANFVQMCKINELLAKVESQNKKYIILKKAYQLKDEELRSLRGKVDCKLMSPKKQNRVVFEDKTNV